MTQRGPGHHHPEYWPKADHDRFEDRMGKELHELRQEVRHLTNRVTLISGALAVIAFVLPIIAPFVRSLVGFPTVAP